MIVSAERIIRAMRRRRLLFFSMILGTLILGVAIGTMIDHSVSAARSAASASTPAPISVPSPTKLSSHFSTVAQKVEKAVVNISTETIVTRQSPPRRQFRNDPFQDFFERFFGPDMPRRRRRTQSLGSGFVVDAKGYILTNAHVVENADTITVKFHSGEEYGARVVGKDTKTDLAVIRVEAEEKLTAARLGDSDGMRQGDWVLAVGSPFGLEQTVTAGIISATGRKNMGDATPWQHFLQTDAAINRGNSGGPLVNMAGEVIGVNTAILTQPTFGGIGGNLGIGFALPSNLATNIYNQLIEHGKVRRGAIGIKMQAQVTSRTLKALGAADGKGVIVEKPDPPDGPAAKAGLEQGDVIVEVDGNKINDTYDMHRVLSTVAPGTTITLKYIRDGRLRTTQLTAMDREDLPSIARGGAPEEEQPSESVRLGISPQNLTPRLAKQFELSEEEGGVYVMRVEPDSIADEAGIEAHDLIMEINKTPTRTVGDVRELTSELKSGMNLLFLVKRWDRGAGEIITLFLTGTVP